jgi:hypothetical protein
VLKFVEQAKTLPELRLTLVDKHAQLAADLIGGQAALFAKLVTRHEMYGYSLLLYFLFECLIATSSSSVMQLSPYLQ